MTTSPHNIDAILVRAIEAESEKEREEYLKQACGADEELRRRVEILIADHFRSGDFLERSPIAETVTTPPVEQPGTNIGPYKLLQVIGEGGMGVVYMAEQSEPVSRRVAVKIIKPGMDSGQVIARFEAERQALAMMDHPNIAKVLDAGSTESGRPYFVMELVKGIPISDYCDEQHFTAQQRLELFVTVCQAVQHAHQKGVIHRDLKPSNVLVAEYDHQAVPKVIDFGVAKATSQKLTEKTMFTQYGQIVGTLEYMSPEQAKLNQLDIDTRSDVYSLGVLLYRLLTGATPFERERLQSAAFEEMLRIIREEEPPRPSTRISTAGKAAATLSGHRRTTPQKLHQFVRGELDWIVMCALEKERSRRYQSASDFASDIERFLAGGTVSACPPSRVYQIRKFVRRHRAGVAAAVTLLCVLSLGLLGTTAGYLAAEHGRAAARDSEQQAIEQTNIATELANENKQLAKKERSERENAERLADDLRRRSYISQVNLAGEAWRGGNVDLAREILSEFIPAAEVEDLRKFEWHYLWREIQETPSMENAVSGELVAITASPDQRVVVVNKDRLNIWPLKALQRDTPLRDEELNFVANWPELSVCVSADGSLVAYVTKSPGPSPRHNLVIRRISGEQLSSTPIEATVFGADSDRKLRVGDMAFAPDNQLLAVALRSEGILLWSVESDGEVEFRRECQGHEANEWITDVEFDLEGELLASAGADGNVIVWDAETAERLATLPHRSPVWTIAFLAEKRIVTGTWEPAVITWAPMDDSLRRYSIEKSYGEGAAVESVAVSADQRLLAVGRSDALVHIRDLETGHSLEVLRGLRGGVQRLAFSPDGDSVAAQGTTRKVQTWPLSAITRPESDGEAAAVTASSRRQAHLGPINWLAIHPTDSIAATASSDRTIKIWNTQTGTLRKTIEPGYGIAVLAEFSADGEYLSVSSFKDEARGLGRWQDDASTPDTVFSGLGYFDPATRYYCRDGVTGSLRVLEWPSRREIRRIDVSKVQPYWRSRFFLPDSTTLALGGRDGALGLWDVESNTELWTLSREEAHSESVASVTASRDGAHVVTCSADCTLKVWDAATGTLVKTLIGHSNAVQDAAFSPNGRTLVSCGSDSRVILWDTETWEQQFTMAEQNSGFHCVGFTADGKTLIAGDRDGTLWFWRR